MTNNNEWTTGKAPWSYEDCKACGGSGWATRAGIICRICSIKSMRGEEGKPSPSLYQMRVSNGGVSQYRLKEAGPVNGSTPEPVAAPKAKPVEPKPEPAKVVAEPKPKPKPKPEPAKKAETLTLAEEVKTDSPNHLIICIGCGPMKADREVRFLSQILMTGPVGKSIAKKLGAPSYNLAPAFERRDLVRDGAPKICKALVGKILVIDSDNVDEREVASSFIEHAGLVIRS